MGGRSGYPASYYPRMTIDELAKTIQARIDALHGEIATLEAARTQLDANGSGPAATTNGAAPARGGSTRAAADGTKPASRGRRAKPKTAAATVVVPAGKLEAVLAHNDGVTTAQLAKLTDGRPEQVLTLLRELEAAGRARRTGERRGTRWHAITDEDRIQARAAELEKQSRQARADAQAEAEPDAETETEAEKVA